MSPLSDVGMRGNTSLIPLTAEQARQKALAALLNNNQNAQGNQYQVDPLPEYDYLAKAGDVASQAAQLNFDSSQNSAMNAIKLLKAQQAAALNNVPVPENPGAGGAMGGSPRLAAVMRALRMQESGGNFGAINQDSGALGGWQIMPSNLQGEKQGWDYDALGRDVSTQEFLRSKAIQRAIVRHKLGQYLKNYGVKGALSAWYSGSPTRWNEKTPQGDYPSVRDYVLQVLDRLR